MYTLLIWMVSLALKVAALWNEKIRIFVDGRKKLFSRIEAAVKGYDDIIWFHVASMGEFEEARPVMEEIRRRFPERKILLTIFSPTGYTHRKNWKTADWVFCLPLDTWFNARRFVRIVRPSKAVFTKGEFWFNYLGRLKRNHVDTYIMSLLASKDSPYLKWYGWPYRRVLKTVYKCVMLKDRKTESALLEFGCRNVEVTGDARIDRVMKIAAEDWHDRIVETWAGGRKAAVAGSSGERENGLFISLLKDYPQDKFLFVPYKPDEAEIRHIVDSAPYGAVLYSDVEYIFSSGMPGNARAGIEETVRKAQVMVVNKIGILSRLYRYGWCALIGGGFGNLPHSVMEAAVYGIPVAMGPYYDKNKQFIDLMRLGTAVSVSDEKDIHDWFTRYHGNTSLLEQTEKINEEYCQDSAGAAGRITDIILE